MMGQTLSHPQHLKLFPLPVTWSNHKPLLLQSMFKLSQQSLSPLVSEAQQTAHSCGISLGWVERSPPAPAPGLCRRQMSLCGQDVLVCKTERWERAVSCWAAALSPHRGKASPRPQDLLTAARAVCSYHHRLFQFPLLEMKAPCCG